MSSKTKKTKPQAPQKSPEQIIEQLNEVTAGFWWAHDYPDGLRFFLYELSHATATLAELMLSPSARPDSESKA
jgi:hypothetical protein